MKEYKVLRVGVGGQYGVQLQRHNQIETWPYEKQLNDYAKQGYRVVAAGGEGGFLTIFLERDIDD